MKRTLFPLLFAASFGAAVGVIEPSPPRTWGRIELIKAEPFGVDTLHSYLGFSVGFLGITRVRGVFNDYSAWILYDEKDPTNSSATVVIDPASIDTGFPARDKDLKDPRFFDVSKYPRILFQTDSIERTGPNRYVVHGTLEIKGIRHSIDLPMTQTVQRGPDIAWGNIRIGGEGTVTVKRTDYGILGDTFWGNRTIANDVEVTIELLGIRSNHDLWGWNAKKPSAGEVVWKVWQASGLDAALDRWNELREKQPDDYDFSPWQLTLLGLRLQQRGRFGEALRVYELALAAAPKDPALLQSRIAEIHAVQGDRDAAIAGYRRVLALDKDDPEAIEMLRRLERSGAGSAAPPVSPSSRIPPPGPG
jgi:polyisoprenoid-binding protein YceI